MKHRVIECGVRGMAVRFPTTIGQVELDGAPKRFAAIDPDRGVGKIGTGLAVPDPELDNFDLVARYRREAPAEIAGEPARLQFELARRAKRGKERAFVDTGGIAKLGVTAGEGHLGEGGGCGRFRSG